MEDPIGKVFMKKLVYDWLPPFCAKCQRVGHVCEDKKKQQKVKMTKKWVVVQQKNPLPSALPSSSTVLEVSIGDEEIAGASTEAPNPTNPTNVKPLVTPISSTQRQDLQDEGAWKLVTRKTKDKGKQAAYQSTRILVQYELHFGVRNLAVGDGGSMGPNPYLS